MNISLFCILIAVLVGTGEAWESSCNKVCTNVKDENLCYIVSSECEVDTDLRKCGGTQCDWLADVCSNGKDEKGLCLRSETWCPSYCACNIFGLNCDPCQGCGSSFTDEPDGNIFSIGESGQGEVYASCGDYHEWMNLTKEEKVKHLDIYYCSNGLEVHPDINVILESLADSNDNDLMSCEEFNNAYDLEHMLEHQNKLHEGERYKIPMSFVLLLIGLNLARAENTRMEQARQPKIKERQKNK
jgi:hypothetical protein